jgi:Heparinase II/III-like protein/Heparinase II/III N-terminus
LTGSSIEKEELALVRAIDFGSMKDAVESQLPRAKGEQAHARALRFESDKVLVSQRFGDIPYDNGNLWLDDAQRTRARFVHGFLFLVDWHGTVLEDDGLKGTFARYALDMLGKWSELFEKEGRRTPSSHHDETTAQRLIQVTSLLPVVKEVRPEEEHAWLLFHASSTADLLATDEFHSAGNNHGMFQDLALLYFSVLETSLNDAKRVEYFELAVKRLHAYFMTCFTAEGVHKENTPTYHLMAAKHVHGLHNILRCISHPHADDYAALLQRAAEYATHALMPNAMYPPISDTTQQVERAAGRTNIFSSPEFAYAASQGKLGSEPASRTLVLPESGYAIYRSSWDDPDATFAMFSAAYNADYHKHSDDLSFFLRSKGTDLLSEAGAYGYDYKNPLTKYAYSSFAHNCLIVDGAGLPRTDGGQHLTTLTAEETRPDGFIVVGKTERFKDTVHRRTIDISEPSGMTKIDIVDEVTSEEPHSYELLWNLGPDVQAVVHGQGFEVLHQGEKLMDLHFEADLPIQVSAHRGETNPRHLGWRFRTFGTSEPTSVVRVRFHGLNGNIKTKIRLNDFSYVDRSIGKPGQQWKRSTTSPGLNYLATEGINDKNKLVVAFTAIHQPGDFTYNYKKTLDKSGFNSLFILDDFGDQGSYYYSDHGDKSIFESVQLLIHSELDRLGLDADDLITVGSSKGGTAALLHGAAAGAGRIIVGAPQSKVGSFLLKPHPNMLRFMTGEASPESARRLDEEVLERIVQMDSRTRVSILVGEADHHYKGHVLPLQAKLSASGNPAEVILMPGLKHSEIGTVYRHFLEANLEQLRFGKDETALPHIWGPQSGKSGTAEIKVHRPNFRELSFRLYRGSELISSAPYSERSSHAWENLAAGKYRVRVYSRDITNKEIQAFTTNWLRIA